MGHRFLSCVGAVLITTFGLPLYAVAQETWGTQPSDTTASAPAAPEETSWLSHLSGTLETDFTNAYFFRGIRQETDGFIAEPWAELYYSLFQSKDGPIRDITIGTGIWFSAHTQDTGFNHDPRALYETDYYPMLQIGLPENFTFKTSYIFYTSPSGAYNTVQELDMKLMWNDSDLLGRFALQPWVNLAIETKRTSFGPRKGEGWQMGINPTLFTIPLGDYPITVTAPVELGLALNDYYEKKPSGKEDTFGYLSFGAVASVPLAFVPKGYGNWSFTALAKGFYLSNTLKNANRGQTMWPQVMGSLTLAF